MSTEKMQSNFKSNITLNNHKINKDQKKASIIALSEERINVLSFFLHEEPSPTRLILINKILSVYCL